MNERTLPPRLPAGPLLDDTTRGPQASLPGMPAWSHSDADIVAGHSRAAFSTNPPSRAAHELPSIGQIDRYALKYRIGEGGLGTVFAAYDPMLSRLVAVKTLHVQAPVAERNAFNALFLHEARAVARLSHPHIVTVFDAGLSNGDAYIAMELLKGVDLRQLRLEGWQPTPLQAAQLARQVAEALAYAHSHGVVHRDIKPANIFMVGRTQPRVLDFGIARVTQRHDLAPDQELSGGSPYYMAPEQVLEQPVDARCDVFSLGVVLYELLAGARPFRGETLEQIHRAVLEHRPPLASAVNAGAPQALARIAARAMATDPDGRYPSASAMARELQQWLASRDAAAPAAAPPPFARPRGVERRVGLAIGVGGVLLLLAGAWWWSWAQTWRGAPAAVAPVTSATPTRGLVQIEASPWAQVEVDGIAVGTAPPLSQLTLPEGRHSVTLRHAQAAPYSVNVDVSASQPTTVAHRFGP